MHNVEVIIVGAGVAGLACALTLHRAGRNILVLEASDAVGGRIRTDIHGDFALDRGFQVLLTAYPTCRELLDMEALHLGYFNPGARLHFSHRNYTLSDPFRQPGSLFKTLIAPAGSLTDKFLIARMRRHLLSMEPDAVWQLENKTTEEFLREFGFSQRIITSFFRPFLSGVFLECGLDTSARMFAFVYRCFSAGHAALPAGGMGAIPNQMEAALPDGSVRLNTPVEEVTDTSVKLADGRTRTARQVVVATDGDQACRWFPELHKRAWTGGTCYYFDAPEAPFGMEKLIWLNSTGSGRINHMAVPSCVAPGYAPPGHALICVNTIGGSDSPEGVDTIKAEMRIHLGDRVTEWKFLRAYPIPKSLPRIYPRDIDPVMKQPHRINGVQLCGDFLAVGSIDGAMESGVRAAESVLQSLQPNT